MAPRPGQEGREGGGVDPQVRIGETAQFPTPPAYATSLANNAGSMLPPDSTTTAVLLTISSLPTRSAASATAPPGSTTSFSSWNAKLTARATSASVAVTPSATSARLTSN